MMAMIISCFDRCKGKECHCRNISRCEMLQWKIDRNTWRRNVMSNMTSETWRQKCEKENMISRTWRQNLYVWTLHWIIEVQMLTSRTLRHTCNSKIHWKTWYLESEIENLTLKTSTHDVKTWRKLRNWHWKRDVRSVTSKTWRQNVTSETWRQKHDNENVTQIEL